MENSEAAGEIDHEIKLINTTHDQPCLTKQSYPWLIISDGADDDEDDAACGDDLNKERHIFYSIAEDRYYEVGGMSRFLQGKFVSCCYHGWLVLEDYKSNECKLFNLSTLDYLNLPPQHNYSCLITVMSSSKIDTKCRFLFLEPYSRTIKSCYVDDTNLVELMFGPDNEEEEEEDPNEEGVIAATNFEGKLYVMSTDYNLMSADFSDPNLYLTMVIEQGGTDVDDFINLGTNFPEYMPLHPATKFYLVESCGELLFIYKNSHDNEVENFKTFKANFKQVGWERVENLGDRAIFLDYYKGLSTSYGASDFGLKPNSIYFVNQFGYRNLYIYDLEDESITLTVPCPIVSATKVSLCWATIN